MGQDASSSRNDQAAVTLVAAYVGKLRLLVADLDAKVREVAAAQEGLNFLVRACHQYGWEPDVPHDVLVPISVPMAMWDDGLHVQPMATLMPTSWATVSAAESLRKSVLAYLVSQPDAASTRQITQSLEAGSSANTKYIRGNIDHALAFLEAKDLIIRRGTIKPFLWQTTKS